MQYPCGQTRRQALWQMGGGFAGLALASLLEQDGFFSKYAAADEPSIRFRHDQPTSHARPKLHLSDDERWSQPSRYLGLQT